MKKFLAIAAAFSAVLAFSSCSKKTQADEFGWFSNFDDAKKAAGSGNKQIILYFSALEQVRIPIAEVKNYIAEHIKF